ncbi:MAG: hypothetical protein UY21_C0010G0027 [Microgenomates group bacterium GW2011_GWA1_48_10]|nr:MAG: hypothetical protein UY21_C0010G0027 [Microgenomates group bacterium GW2011_GWA1_48_10]OHA94338.1 MAG: hypothetical protein A3B88_04475 [Candidatus Zambryskibacteria bacterium RIFCSPHIGHO2_02_FULL_39_19]
MELFNWIISKPELVITIIGWLVTYWFVIHAQDKQHKNEINHEVYKELIQELDNYAGQLSEFSSKVQSYKFTKSFKHMGTEKQAVKKWIDETIQSGTNLQFHKFLQKWESYEIFIQNLQEIILTFKRENDKVMESFQNTFLLNDPEEANNKDAASFETKLDESWELCVNVSCYLMDFKKVLQNYFYKQYGLKAVKPRVPEDKKYLVLTEKGLVKN